MNALTDISPAPLIDSFGRQVTYLRLSVTDRCDLRCTYCMAEKMTFLPRKEILTLEELGVIARAFIARGVKKIRITGGEPLVRKDIMTLFRGLSGYLESGVLDELTLTTNATQLERYAEDLAALGVRRLNVSLDSLDADKFARISRGGDLGKVLKGLDAAQNAGLKIKLNTVALKHDNADEIPHIIAWAHAREMDISLIEVMPLGETGEDRIDQFYPLTAVKDTLDSQWTLSPSGHQTGGPSRYWDIAETGGRLGFISPLTNNFCAGCNRVRVTCTGRLFMCLGQGDYVDLREAVRGEQAETQLHAALDRALLAKPEKHEFDISERGAAPAVPRHMSMTGG